MTKRDGSAECFSVSKLSACLAHVLQSRAYDPRLSRPLARAVAMHLQEWAQPQPPTTQYIFKCVTSVLQQTGLSDVAEELQRHRRQRAARRRRTRVLQVTDGSSTRSHAWRKLAVVATLQNRFGVRHSVARFLAGQIETQIFALNYRVLTKPFIAELIRNEVLAWGLADEQVLKAHLSKCATPLPTSRPEQKKSRNQAS